VRETWIRFKNDIMGSRDSKLTLAIEVEASRPYDELQDTYIADFYRNGPHRSRYIYIIHIFRNYVLSICFRRCSPEFDAYVTLQRNKRAEKLVTEEDNIISEPYKEVSPSAVVLSPNILDYFETFNSWPSDVKEAIFADYFSNNYDDKEGITITSKNGRRAHLFRMRGPRSDSTKKSPASSTTSASPAADECIDSEEADQVRFRQFYKPTLSKCLKIFAQLVVEP
jgi:hypothetical protein